MGKTIRVPSGERTAVVRVPATASGPRSTLSRISGRSTGRAERHQPNPTALRAKANTPATTHRTLLLPGSDGVGRPSTSSSLARLARFSRTIRASPISRNRFLTFRSRHRRSRPRIERGASAGSLSNSSGNRSTSASVCEIVSASNRRLPVSSSHSTTPNDQTSARLSTGLPAACSGLMYAAVPKITPAFVAAMLANVGEFDSAAFAESCS